MRFTHLVISSLTFIQSLALDLDTSDSKSICKAASTIAQGALHYYDGSEYGGSVGCFKPPYYWWEYGVAFGSLIKYQHLCEDNTHENLVYNAIVSQMGDDKNYQPTNQSNTEGNDDQATWGLTVLEAAENGFKSPEQDGHPSWTQLAKNVFDAIYKRWDEDSCNGGLRWQYEESRGGYNYKATVANANLFQMSARLARLTGETKYVDSAKEIYNWILGSGLAHEGEWGIEVYDGSYTDDNCTDVTKVLWTYNYGVLLAGTAYLYDVTKDEEWKDRTSKIISGSQILYNNTVLYERACQTYDICNTDQRVFKAIYARYLAIAAKLIPDTAETVKGLIEPSAEAAAQSCSGGSDGVTCGLNWNIDGWDGKYGLGEQLSALEIIQNLLVTDRDGPKKHN
ncbi:Mannan endo-1,6-alpha-mannosidase [Wickerhamomyces ciferrii]|uniref:mannan endo-1,6-alpha-mannosidase n=1 Tax=Wickerhamomyces ciferrii (strain ATCC 14091 / BCRC 22168 / CBS 111 / JCM 3599 / NBRC 0793 / NRRL Y-1031 F-60-10) TaxID=1206466 RepID=K0KLC0_WICCF|nr:Mannan endo-1,6-alpha-mannosidase [Wickerhamomyces ciferrii]CCH46055.1 Mannan endo-1,6-alpha-mannosidase [Wickerhamomyces ciferrii]